MYLVDRITLAHGLGYDEYSFVGRLAQRFVDIGDFELFVFHESVHSLAYHAQAFLYGFLECASDSHYLSDRLHRRTDFALYAVELSKVPTWNLHHHIVKSRLEECRSHLGDGVLKVKKSVAEPEFGGYECKRISGGF